MRFFVLVCARSALPLAASHAAHNIRMSSRCSADNAAGASAASDNNGLVGALRRVEVNDHARHVVLQAAHLLPGA